jgi:hypothetical protein
MKIYELSALNRNIMERVASAGNRSSPLIAYALDRNLYPDLLHEELKSSTLEPKLPWVNSLFWVRRFYEEGDGSDYIKIIDPNARTLKNSIIATQIFNLTVNTQARRFQLESLKDLEKLRMECFLIGSGENGKQSQLTKGIRFLTKRLSLDFSEDEFDNAMSELEGESYCSAGQLAAARIYREHFINSLRSILSGEGEGWLETVKKHPLHVEANIPVWGIHVNGEVCSIALRVRSQQEQVQVGQGNHVILERSDRGEVTLLWKRLVECGVDPLQRIEILGQNVQLPKLDQIKLARVSGKENFHPFLDPEYEEIQAAELWTVLPSGKGGQFMLCDAQVPKKPFPMRGSPDYRLFRLDLRGIDRSQPHELTFDQKALIRVGAAPWLMLSSGETFFEFHDDPGTSFIFGESTVMELHDYYGEADQVKWNGCSLDADGRQVIKNPGFGQKATARVTIPGRSYSITASVVFLPSEMRRAMLAEERYQTDDLLWEPEKLPQDLRTWIQSCGLCPGILSVGETKHRVSLASGKKHFWIRRGLHEILAHDKPFLATPEDFERPIMLGLYLPEGCHCLRWGGVEWSTSEGPGYWEFALSNRPAITTGPATLKLEIVNPGGELTELLSFTQPPAVIRDKDVTYLSTPDGFNPADWSYALLTEQAIGGRIFASGLCVDLNVIDREGMTQMILPEGGFHPDQGVCLILWLIQDHGDSSVEILMQQQAKPSHGFHGPLSVQKANPFRSRSLFENEIGGMLHGDIPLPAWIAPALTQQRPCLSEADFGWGDFLGRDFTIADLSVHLDQRIMNGDNWLASLDWGGFELLNRITEIENAYQTDPTGKLRRSKEIPIKWKLFENAHPFLHGIHAVTKGAKPDAVWLPLEAFSIRHRFGNHGFHELRNLSKTRCTLGDAEKDKRRIQFVYGGDVRLEYSDTNAWKDFIWDLPPELENGELEPPPRWAGSDTLKNFENAPWIPACGTIVDLFTSLIEAARPSIGTSNYGNLADLFQRICQWMEADHLSPERILIFQVAVLSRLHSWLGANFGDVRSRDILLTFNAAAWANPNARPIFTRDLITVDWAMAWFRVPR